MSNNVGSKIITKILIVARKKYPSLIPRVSLPEHGVAVARHHLAGLEQLPDVVFKLVVGGLQPELLGHLGGKTTTLKNNVLMICKKRISRTSCETSGYENTSHEVRHFL